MKLHCVTYEGTRRGHKFFCTSSADANKKKTALKREGFLKVERSVVEIDQRKTGLIKWLNEQFGGGEG